MTNTQPDARPQGGAIMHYPVGTLARSGGVELFLATAIWARYELRDQRRSYEKAKLADRIVSLNHAGEVRPLNLRHSGGFSGG